MHPILSHFPTGRENDVIQHCIIFVLDRTHQILVNYIYICLHLVHQPFTFLSLKFADEPENCIVVEVA